MSTATEAVVGKALSANPHLLAWVEECARLCKPDRVVWCDGSEEEKERLTALAVKTGVLIPLNQEKLPGCYLHRSDPTDVARVEHLTFICTQTKEEAGPNNNWMAPDEAYRKLGELFDGSMKGRTMYVIPYVMGPIGSPHGEGRRRADRQRLRRPEHADHDPHGDARPADARRLERLQPRPPLDARPEPRAPLHLPLPRGQHDLVDRLGLRRQRPPRQEVPRAAHRLLPRPPARAGWPSTCSSWASRSPGGETTYVAAAFPSACGKTNFAMLIPPRGFDGWKVWTVGDDICWMRPGADGRLWAINPEAGYFGVAPGTNYATNPNAMESIKRDTLYTNVAMTPDGDVWWEGKDGVAAGGADRLARPAVEARLDGEGRPPEQPLHRARREQPGPLAARERPQRRADLGDHLRRPALDDRPARPPGVQLDARRLPRRDDGLGDDGGGGRQGRRRAARPDGDAPLLRLRHGELLRALAEHGGEGRRRSRRSSW